MKIVNDETVEFLKAAIEVFAFAVLDSVDKVGIELGNWSVEDFIIWVVFKKFVADGLDEMGFAEAWTTVEEERIAAGARGVNNALSGSNGDVVITTNNKAI